MASGCSGAIEMAIQALTNPGDNILIPNPGFSLYKTIAGAQGVEERRYALLVGFRRNTAMVLQIRYFFMINIWQVS